MAKITKYKEDKIGPLLLTVAAVTLISWLSIGAQYGHKIYYAGALLVSYMWGIANYSRSPGAYNSGRSAGISYLMMGAGLIFAVSFLTIVFQNPDQFAEYLIDIP